MVTNASWEHFWLNEGWTTYLERRVSIRLPKSLILFTNNRVIDHGCSVSNSDRIVIQLHISNSNRHGEAHRHFSAIIGWDGLADSVKEFGEDNEFTKLVIDLKGKDPDDAFSKVPYEKGFTFLFYLENLLTKESFDKFIPHVSGLSSASHSV